jgi:hypothetical protein
MSDKTYDTIKNIALIVAPVITFLGALISIWNVPFTAEITATLAAIDTLAGAIVIVAKRIYDEQKKEDK